MKKEPDVRLRLIWLFIAQHGWRPSQACLIKWRNIRYDTDGKPIAIVADGGQEDFKTSSPVAARLSPGVAEALTEYSNKNPHTPEQTIFQLNGHPMDHKNIMEIFIRLTDRWNLPKLRPKDMRHWVCTQCRKVDLSKPASAYLLGHNAASGSAMRDWYDNPQKSEVFDEQSAKLPNGPLGLLDIPKVEIIQGLPSEALELLRSYMDGKIGVMEFMTKMESVRMNSARTEITSL
jgi:integrase